jgi:hypothetical protein
MLGVCGDRDEAEGEDLHGEQHAARQRVAEDDDPARDHSHVGGGRRAGDDGHRLALLEAARGGEEGEDAGHDRDEQPG